MKSPYLERPFYIEKGTRLLFIVNYSEARIGVCASVNLAIIGSDNDLSPGQHQVITLSNNGLLSIGIYLPESWI